MKPSRLAVPIPALVLLALLFYRAASPSASGVIDMDYYWHLTYGEWMLDHRRLPAADSWSWTFAGHPYALTQWLGELLMAVAHRTADGTLGTQILSAILLTLTLTFSYVAARAFLDNRLAALAVAFGSGALLVSLPCRPHQFTHLGLAVLTAIVSHYQASGHQRLLLAIPPLLAVWVNLHGGYAVGLAYLWAVVTLSAAEAYMTHRWPQLKPTILPLALATLLGTLATLFNPYGIGAWRYAIEIAGMKASAAGIVDEWSPTNIKMDAGLNWFMVSTAVFATMATSKARPSPSALLAAVIFLAAGWSALRLSLMMAILMVPLLAASLRATPFYTLAFDGPARRWDRRIGPAASVGILVVTLATSVLLGRADKLSDHYVRDNFPVREVAFIKEHRVFGRLLNSPEIGGYLIRHLGEKVSMDTRFDLYGDRALIEFILARRGQVGWQDFIERIDADVVLLDNMSALRQLLSATGRYRMVFEGPRYSILVRPDSHPALPTISPSNTGTVLLDRLAP